MTGHSSNARLRPFQPAPFGRYTLLAPLATGGMGELFLARVQAVGGFEKLCVIKRILPELVTDSSFVDRFNDEARILVKLSHGSIAQVLELGAHDGCPYLALEYVEGKDLRKVAARMRDLGARVPLPIALYVMSRVLDALAYAHRKRDDDGRELHLVHRDVSPQNILVSYEGEVKVIDFGLAKSRMSVGRTNPSAIVGKLLYMAPEQVMHKPVDRRSDLYAVGVSLYELISGQNPFEQLSSAELLARSARAPVPPLSERAPDCPANVAELVAQAMAFDPAERPQTAEDFRARLLSCLFELDASMGAEKVAQFMNEVFAAEQEQERKLRASLQSALASEPRPETTRGSGEKPARSESPALGLVGLTEAEQMTPVATARPDVARPNVSAGAPAKAASPARRSSNPPGLASSSLASSSLASSSLASSSLASTAPLEEFLAFEGGPTPRAVPRFLLDGSVVEAGGGDGAVALITPRVVERPRTTPVLEEPPVSFGGERWTPDEPISASGESSIETAETEATHVQKSYWWFYLFPIGVLLLGAAAILFQQHFSLDDPSRIPTHLPSVGDNKINPSREKIEPVERFELDEVAPREEPAPARELSPTDERP